MPDVRRHPYQGAGIAIGFAAMHAALAMRLDQLTPRDVAFRASAFDNR